MNIVRRAQILAPWALVLALASSVGCASADRPTSTAETGGDPGDEALDPTDVAASPLTGEPGMPRRICTPRAARECRYYYTDESGQRQCPMSYQLCKADGTDWLPCGEYELGATGEPERIAE